MESPSAKMGAGEKSESTFFQKGGEASVDAEMIERINQLARKSKGPGLTKQEKEEQARLRQEYIQAVRRNLRGQLDQIDVIERDGSIVNLGEKIRKK